MLLLFVTPAARVVQKGNSWSLSTVRSARPDQVPQVKCPACYSEGALSLPLRFQGCHMVRAAFARISNFATKIFSKKRKDATYRIVVAVSLLTLPATAIVSLLVGPTIRRSGRTFVKPATIVMQVPMIVDVPAISDPTFLTAAEAELDDDDLVIGVSGQDLLVINVPVP